MAECYTINYTKLCTLMAVVVAFWNRKELCMYTRALIIALACFFHRTLWCQIKNIIYWILRPDQHEKVDDRDTPGQPPVQPVQQLMSVPLRHRSSLDLAQAMERKNNTVDESPRPSASFLAGIILGRSEGLHHPLPRYFISPPVANPMLRSIQRKRFGSPSTSPNVSPSNSATSMYYPELQIPPPTMHQSEPPTTAAITNPNNKRKRTNSVAKDCPRNVNKTLPIDVNPLRRTRNGTVYNRLLAKETY